MRIALKEQLVSLTSSMYSLQLHGAPDVAGDQFFDDAAQAPPSGGHSGGPHR
jgi:hypothetical protein